MYKYVLFLMSFSALYSNAINLSPAVIARTKNSRSERAINTDISFVKCPYGGVALMMPCAGVSFRALDNKKNTASEFDIRAGSIVILGSVCINASKLFFYNIKNESSKQLQGSYYGVGAGGGIHYVPLNYETVVPFPQVRIFVGSQRKSSFIDFGVEFIYYVPIPTLRCGVVF